MTTAASDRHTRVIGWLKVVLPLVALGLLSTLFLLSRTVDPEARIPFAKKEIQDRLRDQQVTGPFFTGTTTNGDEITFAAERLTTPRGQTGANEAQDVEVTMVTADGGSLPLAADRARVDMTADSAELEGAVTVETSTGYRIASDLLTARMSALDLASPGPVRGTAPGGTLEAGAMHLTRGADADAPQLFFTNRVKLVYSPDQPAE